MALYGLNNPCHECAHRKPGCNCEVRKLYLAELQKRKDAINAARNREMMITNYQIDQKRKAKRKRDGKDIGKRRK